MNTAEPQRGWVASYAFQSMMGILKTILRSMSFLGRFSKRRNNLVLPYAFKIIILEFEYQNLVNNLEVRKNKDALMRYLF
jgi:hypothetical protein